MGFNGLNALSEREIAPPVAACRPEALAGLGIGVACVSFIILPLPAALASTILGVLMIVGADVDARTYRLPNSVTYGTVASGLAAAIILYGEAAGPEILAAGLRGLGTAAAFFIVRWLYGLIRHQEGMGLGDVKLAAAIGVWLPIELIPVCIGVASTTALFTELCFNLRQGRLDREARIPFGAYLCPALWLTFFVSTLII